MKKKLAIALSLAMIMTLALTACGNKDQGGQSNTGSQGNTSTGTQQPAPGGSSQPTGGDNGPAPKDGGSSVTFTTGGESGTYYGFGNVIAGKVGDMTSTTVKAITSNGSAHNIQSMDDGDAQFGFVQSDVMVYAYNGERTFAENGASTGFSTVADLEGKKVSVGAPASGVFFNAVDVLTAYGLGDMNDKQEFTKIDATYQSFQDSAEALKDGQIDAAFIVAGAPTTAVTDLASGREISLVSLDDEHINALIAACPYYSKNVISKDVYNLAEDTTTVAVGAVVIARDDVSDVDVYNFLYGTFEDVANLSHGKAAELDLDFAASVTSIGYHPGAVAYFADKGITVPAKG